MMRKIKNAMSAVVLGLAVSGGGYIFLAGPLMPTAEAHWRDHPKLEGAYNSLKDAKEYLDSAPTNFHGHKAEAIRAIDEAMHKLSLCAEEEERRTDVGIASQAEHPRLRTARDHLKDAREYLHEAKQDFRGHKEEAIKAIDVAIKEIERCMEE